MPDLTTTQIQQVTEALQSLEKKYEDLVWYARSPRSADTDYWKNVPHDIREGAFRNQMRVEEEFPDEVEMLRMEKMSDWQHGFHSGCLASIRFALTAMYRELIEGDDDEPFWIGGLEDAYSEFPMLDT